MIYTVTIPNWKPTLLNRLMGNWRKAIRLKAADTQMIGMYAKVAEVPAAIRRRRVRIEVTIAGQGRSPDPDGLLKSTLDALVACQLIRDDSVAWCEWSVPVILRGKPAQTVITLEDME